MQLGWTVVLFNIAVIIGVYLVGKAIDALAERYEERRE